jgi:hypothetical protein
MASAISLPINSSPEDTVPTRVMSAVPLTGWETFLIVSTATVTAFCMPRFMTMGLAPAAIFFRPSRTISCARSVAVVGSVAGDVVCLGGDFADEIGAHVLKGVEARSPWL